MSHTMSWLVDKRVIYVEYDGDVDQEELLEVNEKLKQFVEIGEAPIHIISDNSKTLKMNMNLKTIQKSFTVLRRSEWGFMCIVGANTMLNFFAQLVSNSFRLKVNMLGSIEEAKALLNEKDSSLPQL